MKFYLRFFSNVIILSLFLTSCSEVRNIAYLQSKAGVKDSIFNVKSQSFVFDAHIKPKDVLNIVVVTSEPQASKMFNLVVPQVGDVSSANQITIQQPVLQNYLVDVDGMIDFPVFGKIKVGGLTRKELENILQEKLASSFNSSERPVVTIRFANFSVNVVGEVARPGKYLSNNERITVFEALAMAGDLTIYGRRDNIKVLREDQNGNKRFITVNLNSDDVLRSPAYYLEQNDVIYIEPNQAKARTSMIGSAETLAISAVSILISTANLVYNILRK